MSDKRYPTRMHEVLGVETGEVFTVTWNDTKKDFSLDGFGIPEDIETEDIDGLRYPASGPDVVYMVNHPERITSRPRLTEEQVRVLEALYEVFDFKWLVKQKDGQVMAYANRPNKADGCYGCWFSGEGENEEDYGWIIKSSSPVCSLVSWSDPAPLDIVQTLRDAGVEVDDA